MIQQTLVLLKPDAVQRGFTGKIIERFENVGLKIVAMKMVKIDTAQAEKHYFDIAQRHGKKVLDSLVGYITQGPVIAMILEGVNAVENVRKMVGSTYPNEATPGSIRGDYSHISKQYANDNNKVISNLIHASAKPKEAEYEIKLWFKTEEIYDYKITDEMHVM